MPGSSSEKVKKPLFISLVLGPNILVVAVWGLTVFSGSLSISIFANNLAVELTGLRPVSNTLLLSSTTDKTISGTGFELLFVLSDFTDENWDAE